MFESYDVNKDGLLLHSELVDGMTKDLPDEQAVKDTIDMLTSLYSTYDVNGNGLDKIQFTQFAHVTDHVFDGHHAQYDEAIHGPGDQMTTIDFEL